MRAYLISLTAAAILAALIRRAAPAGGAGQGARLGAGLLVLAAMLLPLGDLDLTDAAENIAQNGFSGDISADETDTAANALMEELITEAAEAYILDKAQALEFRVTAEVTCRLEDYYPVPWSVTIRGDAGEDARAALSEAITQELGIPEERQEWLDM